MVTIDDDVAREIAAEFRRYTAGPDTAFYQHCADLLDPPKPPPDEQDTESTRPDGIDMAWGLIANAYGGNWELASDEWRKAAERWRDENLKSPPLMTQKKLRSVEGSPQLSTGRAAARKGR